MTKPVIDVVKLFDDDATPVTQFLNELSYCSISFDDIFKKLELKVNEHNENVIIRVIKPDGTLSHEVNVAKCRDQKINGSCFCITHRIELLTMPNASASC